LVEFRDLTAAVAPFYRERGLSHEIDGMASIDEVSTRIDAILKQAVAA
jgi:adenylate kinase